MQSVQTILKRRAFLRTGMAALAGSSALGLIGCGGSGSGAAAASSTTPLRLEFWGTTERNKRTREVMTLFEQRYPSVKMTSQFADFNSYWTKLGIEISGGNLPDLLQMDMGYIAQFVQKGLLLDLTKYIPNSINLSDFDPILLKGSEANHTMYGIPLGGNSQAAFYRTDLVSQAKVGDPDPTMTWDEFATYAGKIAQALGKGFWGCEDGSNDQLLLEVFIRQRGKEMYTEDGQINFSKQDLIDWWTYWSHMRASGACLPASVGVGAPPTTMTPSNSLLIAGKMAFHFDWSNLIVDWQQFTPHKLGMAAYPQGPSGSVPGQYFKVSQLMSIAAQTKHPEEAATFVNFMINDTGAIKALDIERGIPGAAKARALLKPQLTPTQREELAYIDQVAKYARPKTVLDPPGANQVVTAYQLYASKIAFGQLSIPVAVDRFFSDAQKALEQMKQS